MSNPTDDWPDRALAELRRQAEAVGCMLVPRETVERLLSFLAPDARTRPDVRENWNELRVALGAAEEQKP